MVQTSNLKSLVDRYYDDLVFSLSTGGLNVKADDYDPVIISRNAYKSTGILISVSTMHLNIGTYFCKRS